MRVAIAGAGAVGRSIAQELLGNGHDVLLIDKDPDSAWGLTIKGNTVAVVSDGTAILGLGDPAFQAPKAAPGANPSTRL